ncbi:MAG: T9SS type A sorting domain-containing protein [Ignavibacteria bacterium]|nr:T9SS type A sorting domain-containing protein [Ignavibacteria bacterium]
MKHFNLFAILCIILMFFYSGNVFSQHAVSHNSKFPFIDISGDSCVGTGSEHHDRGIFNGAGGWSSQVTEGRIVLKFTPSIYPWKYERLCIAFTSLMAMADSLQFDIVIYDTSGTSGIPGTTPVFTLPNQVARPISGLPEYSWFSFDISASPQLNNGSYYIGIKYDASQASQGEKYILFDCDTAYSLWPGYGWSSQIGQWAEAQTVWPLYRCFGMRTMGSSPNGITNINAPIPVNYNLKQNFPNPFNPVTKISFDIPKSGLVTLKVYNILGTEIATLVNEVKNPGSYLVDFNASALSSGVYFYKMETGGFSAVKRMVLVK